MATLKDSLKNELEKPQKLDNPPIKIEFVNLNNNKKITKSGLKVELDNKTVTIIYSKSYKVMLTFASKKEAKKEFGKHRRNQ